VNVSGEGSAHGPWGFAAFSHERAVVTSRIMIAEKLLPPYTRVKQRLIGFFSCCLVLAARLSSVDVSFCRELKRGDANVVFAVPLAR
jgi:hypothetical protein